MEMDKKLVSLLFLFFLMFGVFASIVVFNAPLSTLTRAKEETVPSAEKSKIIYYPFSSKADGASEVTIYVFVTSVTDKPLTNKVVTLTTSLGQLKETSQVSQGTDAKAIFYLTSQTPGLAVVETTIDNSVKLKPVSVNFE